MRAFLLAAHSVGLIELFTSEAVLEELFEKLVAKAGLSEAHAEAVATTIEHVLNDGGLERVVADEALKPIVFTGPDPDDAHVVAAALATNVDFILTRNHKHFPDGALSPFDLDAVDPDGFFAPIIRRVGAPEAVELIRVALSFPPAGVTTCGQLGMRLHDCGMQEVGETLLSASWQAAVGLATHR